MMRTNEQEVDFYAYCQKCKYVERDADLIPCTYCLDTPVREGTNAPTKFEEKE